MDSSRSEQKWMAMASQMPKNEEEMRQVSGVGPKKWVEYREIFLAALREG